MQYGELNPALCANLRWCIYFHRGVWHREKAEQWIFKANQ